MTFCVFEGVGFGKSSSFLPLVLINGEKMLLSGVSLPAFTKQRQEIYFCFKFSSR